jgi:putative membrane protein
MLLHIMKMNSLFRSVALSAMLALGLLTTLRAAAADTEQRGQLSSKDYKFVTDAAKGGMTEVELGQLAEQKASNPAIKDFGKKMAEDHKKANDELTQLVSQKGATLPADVTSTGEKRVEDHLRNLSGADFDKAYMDHMVKDHKKDVKEFEKMSKEAKDPELKAWAAKTLPTLQQHLQTAENLDQAAKAEKKEAK